MFLQFTTKKDINGNRKYLIIDTANNTYTTEYNNYFYKSDFIEITATNRKKLIDQLNENGVKKS